MHFITIRSSLYKCFSLIEVVVVISVLSIISIFAVSSLVTSRDTVESEVAIARLSDFVMAQRSYLAMNGYFSNDPSVMSDLYSYDVTSGLSDNVSIVSMYVDKDGNLWSAVKDEICYVSFTPHPLSQESAISFSNSSECSAEVQSSI